MAEQKQQGRAHWGEPEDIDSLSFIDFEDEDYDAEDWSWHEDAFRSVLEEVEENCVESWTQLHDAYHGGGDPWQVLENIVVAAGFDVYNSDSRFEVFPAGSFCGFDCCQQEVREQLASGKQVAVVEPIKVTVSIYRRGGLIESVDVESDGRIDFDWKVIDEDA